jgi:hypothetical protein
MLHGAIVNINGAYKKASLLLAFFIIMLKMLKRKGMLFIASKLHEHSGDE